MSRLKLLSLVLVLVFYMNSQLVEVGARMPDDMIEKTQLNEPQAYKHPNVNPSQVRKLQLGPFSQMGDKFNRLPGVCKRIRRRRIRILCNVEKYCSVKLDNRHGQICPCLPGSKCGHFFLKSL